MLEQNHISIIGLVMVLKVRDIFTCCCDKKKDIM